MVAANAANVSFSLLKTTWPLQKPMRIKSRRSYHFSGVDARHPFFYPMAQIANMIPLQPTSIIGIISIT